MYQAIILLGFLFRTWPIGIDGKPFLGTKLVTTIDQEMPIIFSVIGQRNIHSKKESSFSSATKNTMLVVSVVLEQRYILGI